MSNQHPRRVHLCPALGDLRLSAWLALPVLFLLSVAGVAAALFAGTGSDSVSLSAPLLFGCASALSLLTSGHVEWRTVRQRWMFTGLYLAVLIGAALGFDGVRTPVDVTLALGAVAAVVLGAILLRNRPARTCPTQS